MKKVGKRNFVLITFCLLCHFMMAQTENTDLPKQKKTYQKINRMAISAVPIYNNSPIKCSTCECNLENIFRSWNKENIINHDTLKLIDYKLTDTLTDSLKIRHYFSTMTDPDCYYAGYDGNTRKAKVLQGKSFTHKESLQYRRDQLSKSLKLYNTVYVIRMQVKEGAEIKNYVICDKDKKQAAYDNMFFNFRLFK